MQGKLLTQNFLEKGIEGTDAWRDFDERAFSGFRAGAEKVLRSIRPGDTPNEAVTEAEIIRPLLELLGWADYLPQQTASGGKRTDIPDYLLFANMDAKAEAMREARDDRRYPHAIAVLEAKRWQRPLDRGDGTDRLEPGTPSNQILRYLSRAEVASNRVIQWGFLTNGRHWRLYYQGARSRSEEFLEFDLAPLLAAHDVQADLFSPETSRPEHFLRLFWLLFRREAFLPQPGDAEGRSLHQIALAESRYWESEVSRNLGERVFERIFPELIRALARHDPEAPGHYCEAYLEELREGALIFLYRLLFLFFAEDRALLPVHDSRYDDYSLRAIRTDIADRVDGNDTFSDSITRYAHHLQDLFGAVSKGDASIGVPPYNGGLFNAARHPLLARVELPDAVLVDIIDGLSREGEADDCRWINYRDLSVQHLGSIYERLLEHVVVADEQGVSTRLSIFGRKDSGSYYTHDDLVKRMIEETLAPLIEERVNGFDEKCRRLKRSRKPKSQRLLDLADADAAAALLDLKICDPAMGSGHFLVALVDYVTDRTLELMAAASETVDWAPQGAPYESPLARRIRDIRERILSASKEHGWTVEREQFDDRHIVRRMILKRVIHGVDKNPMAVELAKVSLWLHTFTVGAPLSFLDHHIRCGDALYGERVARVLDELRDFGALFHQNVIARIGNAAESMSKLSELTDVDIAEVQTSRELFGGIEHELKPLWKLLDFWQGLRWIAPLSNRKKPASEEERGLSELLSGRFGELIDVVATGGVAAEKSGDMPAAQAAHALLDRMAKLADRERFMHWEVAFPAVWLGLSEGRPQGGFDAVIGNPPWDKMRFQEVEWFAARRPEIVHAARAADRKRMIAALQDNDDPLWRDYLEAKSHAEAAVRVARQSGEYPLLSGGDVNIYSLFVERASHLVKPEGIVGLLTPSGIASDRGASRFFKIIATAGRIKALYDFENKKVFFPDIHASFKFCALVFGGAARRFDTAHCAFFLHAVAELDESDKAFALTADDFAAVNPNTGTAPIFRSRRDAEITKAVYQRFPVLVDKRGEKPKAVWPVKYTTMFHMTNDSGLFKRRNELEADGYYPVAGNRWKKGEAEYVPLYEGKMVQMYDHRAASIHVNPDNLNRPGQPIPATSDQHIDPSWLPEPRFWVPASSLPKNDLDWALCFKCVTAPTNVRTMISAILPYYGVGHSMTTITPLHRDNDYKKFAPLFFSNLNSVALDYILRQKVQGQNLSIFILEQLPVISPERFEDEIGGQKIGDFVRGEVLYLTYTAEDMRPFARDMGFEGEPFAWDEEDRRHRMARLDALFFHLYGIGRDDAGYILDQFPIVRRDDEAAFGHYRTRELVLAYMNAVAAGDLTTRVDT